MGSSGRSVESWARKLYKNVGFQFFILKPIYLLLYSVVSRKCFYAFTVLSSSKWLINTVVYFNRKHKFYEIFFGSVGLTVFFKRLSLGTVMLFLSVPAYIFPLYSA